MPTPLKAQHDHRGLVPQAIGALRARSHASHLVARVQQAVAAASVGGRDGKILVVGAGA